MDVVKKKEDENNKKKVNLKNKNKDIGHKIFKRIQWRVLIL